MPELPEVETIRRQLAPLVQGMRLERVEILDSRWSHPLAPHELKDALVGRRVQHLDRRGKYLLWGFSDEVYLAQHLRMTGAVLCEPTPEPSHVRVRLELSGAMNSSRRKRARRHLVIVDPRRFGTGQLILGDEALESFFSERLGYEPLHEEFTPQHLRALTRGRTTPIKALLLDQRRIAGVGNIYADEALFRAGIHPLRPAGRLTSDQVRRLREGVIDALEAGIEAKGATIDDFRHVDGFKGSFQNQFLVHRRAGESCPNCASQIVKLVVAGRGTYVCERCQRKPRKARKPPTPRS
ncbi:MAG TPA: bifunctional DNA-formamidopyrimidine glycosylase/DNA-(apurinic or apyrimidinic site) lyase [Solirubrobacteraceae bacterium]|jgi:formamidopyrimidine-DNA glycosylase